MTLALPKPSGAAADLRNDPELHARINDVRAAMESEIGFVRERCKVYLNWYSPAFNSSLGTHDAWWVNGANEALTAESIGLTRANFPIARSVVDIWTSLEAANAPTARAEPERIQPPPPVMDQVQELALRQFYDAQKQVRSMEADARSAYIRRWLRLDDFPLKHYLGVRRKNLYGFSWTKVVPNRFEKRPMSRVLRNPTVVYPIWSDREPDSVEMLLVAYQESARVANAKWGLGLQFDGRGRLVPGQDSGYYRDLNDRWMDATRTMVWVEEFWWIDRRFEDRNDPERQTGSDVSCTTRVAGRIVKNATYKGWRHIPYVPYINTDERDSYGWSDIASVIDINDEINRRMSQQGDIIGMYAAPRFQLLNATIGRDVDMPGPFELIPLNDQERIEQILARIDVFPAQAHFTTLIDLLHRVSGLPPIVWGLIANAQTSGRALTASWKATEARLSPKLMANEQSLRRYLSIVLDYARLYDWNSSKVLFTDDAGDPFTDIRWSHPPMEPRDFQEVTMNAITKRDAGLISTVKAMREIGDEAAEDTIEEVMAEFQDPMRHPDKAQAFVLWQRAVLEVMAMQQQLGGGPQGAGAGLPQAAAAQEQVYGGAPAPGQVPPPEEGGALPPAQPGVPQPVEAAPEDTTLTSGTLVRGGEVSNQMLETRRF